MQTITLISSFHTNLGKCNPHELYKIIEEIQPEIIFEELCFESFSALYTNGQIPNSIEAIAVKNYLRNYPIKHFPVDTHPVSEKDLFHGANDIAKINTEYKNRWKEYVFLIKQDGHKFLNSNACIELLDKIRSLEEATLKEINNPLLSREYKSERELYDKREDQMLKNIYKYSNLYPYSRAILICGVEHRKPIMLKIPEHQEREMLQLNWTFYGGIL